MGESDRKTIVKAFVDQAISGDIEAFTRTLTAINWPGAWFDILSAATDLEGRVHPDIQVAFRAAWHGWPYRLESTPIMSTWRRWSLGRDLVGSLHLLASMKQLLPLSDAPSAPLVLYRGQSVAELDSGTHGLWWSPEPTYAEFYARDPHRSEGGVVVAAFAPGDAVVCGLSPAEFLVDPRRLLDVVTVATLPAYTADEIEVGTNYASCLMGIPSGWDANGIDQWLAMGRPESGVPACRFRREVATFEPLMVA